MQSEGDGERDRPPQGKMERWGRRGRNDAKSVVTGKGRLKKYPLPSRLPGPSPEDTTGSRKCASESVSG